MTKSPTTATETDLDAKSKSMADAHDATTQAPSGTLEQPDNAGKDGGAIDTHATIAAQLEADALAAEASAQANADAEAQAKADADADELAKARALVAAADAAERAEAEADAQKAVANLAVLNDLLVIVEQGNTDEKRDALFKTLNKEHGMKVKNGEMILHGIRVVSSGPLSRTFADWCMEARRTIMAGAVE